MEVFQITRVLELLIAKRGELVMNLSSLGTRRCFVELLNGWPEVVCNDFSWLFKARIRNLVSLS